MPIKTVKLYVEGMSCSHCEKAVKEALISKNGVLNAEVDLIGKTATVRFETDLTNEEVLIEAIEEAGYIV
ncbi:heavy-metal-associated domain-containing protein [Anaerobium acetethylicum]|uniref:Copper chaperone CopZ n=1 Tax=Anaerobium acetethylicum TaxID=1619234 RepID=A0A1D3TWG5_9FIRM|nr:heavy-metal-associated domain-containing protein [Anaerobium acetethylicum]SCP98557.1 copper chaperone [Anaerobium acetethylicum]